MRGKTFIFDSVQLSYYKCKKSNFKRIGLYIESPYWIKDKKATINSKSKNYKCFQYAETVALNYREIQLHQERVLFISNI